MKRANLKSLLLMLAMQCVSVGISAYSSYDFKVDGICYNVLSNEDKTCEVTENTRYYLDYGTNSYSGKVVIPSVVTYNSVEYNVVRIGDEAFYNCCDLKEIIIPNSITSIGNKAFDSCERLTKINIPNSVSSIGDQVFRHCRRLKIITIPNSVSSIGKDAFEYCDRLKEVNIPNSVSSIGDRAFKYCNRLKKIIIPKSVSSIGKEAFKGCGKLETIIVEDGNKFYDSRNNCNAIIETSSNTLIVGCRNSIVPNSVSSIGAGAFYSVSELDSINIPNSVSSIGNEAFYRCYRLNKINIPNSVSSIGNKVFNRCNSLKEINIPNSVSSIGNEAFEFCNSLKEINIPNSVSSIGNKAFSYCGRLKIITIPNSVSSIGNKVFIGCCNLDTIIVEDGNKFYDSRNDCNAIIETSSNTLIVGCRNSIIPNSVSSIGEGAFCSVYELDSINIPNSVSSIGNIAFSGCTRLTKINIPNSVSSIGNEVFKGCGKLETIIVEDGNKFYDSRNNCNAIIETSSNTLIVGCRNSIIPNSVSSIGEDAFYSVHRLHSINIPNSVNSIGRFAFLGCHLRVIHSNNITPPSCIGDTFERVKKKRCVLYVPEGAKEAYASAKEWREFKNIIEVR